MKKITLVAAVLAIGCVSAFAAEMDTQKLAVVKVSMPEPNGVAVTGEDPVKKKIADLEGRIAALSSVLKNIKSAQDKAVIQREIDVLKAELAQVKAAKPAPKQAPKRLPNCSVIRVGEDSYGLFMDGIEYLQPHSYAESAEYMIGKCQEAHREGRCKCVSELR